MKIASALVLSFIASAQAATTISSLILPSGVPASSGLPFSTVSFDTTAASSVLSSLSSLYSAESSVVQSVLSSVTTGTPSIPLTVKPSGSTSTGAPATTTSSAAGRTEAGLGLGLAAGAAAGFVGFVF
ncbi:hypothetical protein BDR03DRAFT_1009304 [Suillus americanus]|nr:hypothetical protein BDR03DRAFT_1009304 [Suillus americanus]